MNVSGYSEIKTKSIDVKAIIGLNKILREIRSRQLLLKGASRTTMFGRVIHFTTASIPDDLNSLLTTFYREWGPVDVNLSRLGISINHLAELLQPNPTSILAGPDLCAVLNWINDNKGKVDNILKEYSYLL